jgi:hypothetical protein
VKRKAYLDAIRLDGNEAIQQSVYRSPPVSYPSSHVDVRLLGSHFGLELTFNVLAYV